MDKNDNLKLLQLVKKHDLHLILKTWGLNWFGSFITFETLSSRRLHIMQV